MHPIIYHIIRQFGAEPAMGSKNSNNPISPGRIVFRHHAMVSYHIDIRPDILLISVPNGSCSGLFCSFETL